MNTRPKILLVDDELFNMDYLEQELEDKPYELLTANNGQKALEMIAAHQPDMVLLDIMMPIMDGFSVLQQIKANSKWNDMAVVIISANNDMTSVVKGIEMGADDFLPKPFNPVLLHARINSGLEKKRLRDLQRKLFHTFTASEVADEVMAKGFELGGKHVEVSILFSDIRGFTTLAEAQNPAETIQLLNRYYTRIFQVLTDHGGLVNQIQGDGIMTVFGVPVAAADDRERAVLAAQEILRQVDLFNQDQKGQGKAQIKIGIGIASGKAVGGYAGSPDRATYTYIGDVVNTAARLEAHTKTVPHLIVIDQVTQEGLPASIKVASLGEIEVKGKTKSVKAFGVVR
ncbi:MAG: response regulator [Chloroflexi bacterium]|nr:response regulator [Chloroflexota bacterium]